MGACPPGVGELPLQEIGDKTSCLRRIDASRMNFCTNKKIRRKNGKKRW